MQKLEKKLNKESFKFLKELVKSWQYSWKDIKEKVDIENWGIIWKWNLNIRWTKVKKVKAKRIEWNLYVNWAEYLEDIEVEEDILWYLDVRWTKIKRIKAKKIAWFLDAEWEEYLEDIEVEEIGWNININRTNIDFQKKILEKIKKWELKVKWKVVFWGDFK